MEAVQLQSGGDTGRWSAPVEVPKPFWRYVIGALSVIFVLHIVHLRASTGGDLSVLTYPDERNYYVGGAELIQKEGLRYFLTPRSVWNAPLYPLWIALLGISIPLVKILNLLMISLAGACVADSARRLCGRGAGLTALGAYSLYYPFFVFGGTVLSEPPFVFAMAVALWCWVVGEGRSFGWSLFAGISLGVGALIRPTIQLFPLLFVMVAAGYWLGSRSKNRDFIRAAIGCFVGAALLIVPYVAKNAILFGRPTIANGFGAVMYLGSDLRKDGNEPIYSRMDFDTYEKTAPYTHLDSEGDSILVHAALANMAQFPLDSALLIVRKMIRFLIGDFRAYFYPFDNLGTYYKYSSAWATFRTFFEVGLRVAVVTFALLALFFVSSVPRSMKLYLGTFVAYFVAIHGVSFPIPRLSLPMYPVLCVLAAVSLWELKAWWRVIASAGSICATFTLCLYGRYWDYQVVSDRYTTYFSPVVKIDPNVTKELEGIFTAPGWIASNDKSRGAMLTYAVPPFEGKVNQVVFLELEAKVPKGGANRWEQGMLSWRGVGEDYSPVAEAGFPIQYNGEKQTYMVSPGLMDNWRRPIQELRISFPTGRGAERYRLSRIEVAR